MQPEAPCKTNAAWARERLIASLASGPAPVPQPRLYPVSCRGGITHDQCLSTDGVMHSAPTRTAGHTVTALLPPRCSGSRKVPGQRRIAHNSAARIRLAPACSGARHTLRCVVGESHCDRPAPAPMWWAALSTLLTADLSAHSPFAGRATCNADGESHDDRPAPATTWRAALSAGSGSSAAWLPASAPFPPLSCG